MDGRAVYASPPVSANLKRQITRVKPLPDLRLVGEGIQQARYPILLEAGGLRFSSPEVF
jgi:hypothetical protein